MAPDDISHKECENCKKPMPKHKRAYARFCSNRCSKEKWSSEIPKTSIPRGSIGAVSELVVCADLLAKGYYVFRNVSAHGPCDIIILKNDKCFRVEVKTGTMLPTGTMVHSPVSEGESHDILAVVLDGRAIYLNELP